MVILRLKLHHYLALLPFDDLVGEKLVDELEVVWLRRGLDSEDILRGVTCAYLHFLNTGNIIALAVEIIRIECLDCLQHSMIMLIHQLVVSTSRMPWIEGMVSDHGEGLGWQSGLVFDDVVEIFIVAPGEHYIIQPATRCIDSKFGAVDWVVIVRVALKSIWVDNTPIESTTDREGITDNIPLTLSTVEEKKLAKIVDQTS